MQQQPEEIVCSKCGTSNKPGAFKCSRCESVTGLLRLTDTTSTRGEEPLRAAPVFLPAAGVPTRQVSQESTPAKVQGSLPSRPTRSPFKLDKRVLIGGLVLIVLVAACIPTGFFLFHIKSVSSSGLKATPTSVAKLPPLPVGIGSVNFDGQYVGVNDGSSFPFDRQRQDSQNLRQQAREALQSGGGGSGVAISLWHQYLSEDNENDAEILIYLQNQYITQQNYVTLIVGLDFPKVVADSPDAIASTRSALQGAYVAQKEFNDRSKDIKLRLLLVNTADDDVYIAPVAKQMASIIKSDTTIVGILGWQTSVRTESMLKALQNNHITLPMLTQTASSDYLTDGHWNNLFRIAPLDKAQAQAAVLQAKKLQATEAIVFMDQHELYSQNLGQDIEQNFEKSFPGAPVIEKNFTVENTSIFQFSQLLHDVLNKVQDRKQVVVFFTGTTDRDVGRFQDALTGYPNLRVIAGDAGYVAHPSSHGHWYFVAYAYHDEWQTLMGSKAPFSQEYSDDFDPENRGGGYGTSIADAVAVISYDAANVLLRGIEIARLKGAVKPTGQDLQNALVTITGSNAWQGVSGRIDFDENHEAIDKSLITLWVDPKGDIQMLCIQGQFAGTATNGLSTC